MNKIKMFFFSTATFGKMAALMIAVSAAAAVEPYFDEEMGHLLEQFPELNQCTFEQFPELNQCTFEQCEEMGHFLEQFPELNQCTFEQCQEALSFYKESEEVEALLVETSKAVDAFTEELAQEEDEESFVLQHLAEDSSINYQK